MLNGGSDDGQITDTVCLRSHCEVKQLL